MSKTTCYCMVMNPYSGCNWVKQSLSVIRRKHAILPCEPWGVFRNHLSFLKKRLIETHPILSCWRWRDDGDTGGEQFMRSKSAACWFKMCATCCIGNGINSSSWNYWAGPFYHSEAAFGYFVPNTEEMITCQVVWVLRSLDLIWRLPAW